MKEKKHRKNKKKTSIFKKITKGLALACQVILSAPLKLPNKLVSIAKYISMALGLLNIVADQAKEPKEKEGSSDER